MAAMDPDQLEELLAEALAAYDQGGDAALARFVAGHPAARQGLERGLARCRQMGLLGSNAPARDFPERLGEFRLLRRLGSGGMGVVYEAEQESLGRRVALKVVRPELLYFEGARERFRREIEAVARLSHPAVVPVLASGEQDGVPWYAMELFAGSTVHEVCQKLAGRDPTTLAGTDLRAVLGASTETGTDPFPGPWWQLCVRIAHSIAIGVRHAHLRGIVHRDIKPSNVMLTGDGRAVLLDFGVAMVGGGRDFTRTGHTPGSPAFMSPEQLRGDAVDERTDVYSLAATLWQMVALAPPFPAGGDLLRQRDAAPPSLAARNRQVPRELELVVRTAMDPDRERRYPDAEAFAEDLFAVLQRRPIRARRLGWSLRSWRWCQRHRVAATLLACTMLAVLVLPTAFAWRERATNRALATAVQLADESLDTTLDAIYGLIVRVSDEKLRHVPAAAAVAREALQDACAMYRTLLAKYPDHERLRRDHGRAQSRLGELLARLGEVEPALAAYREALAGLGGDDPDQPAELLDARAIARLNLANLLQQTGRNVEAATELVAVAADADRLPEHGPTRVPRLRQRLQLALERSHALDPVLDASAAEALLRQAVDLAREVVAAAPGDLDDAARLVAVLDTLATLLTKNQRHADAQPLLEEALQRAQALPPDARIWPPPNAVVADVAESLGNLLVARRDLAGAAHLKDCLARREQLVADFPQDLQFQSDLGAALHNLASMNFFQGQDDLALERLDRALPLQRRVLAQMPQFTQAQDYLRNHLTLRGSTLAKLGRRADLETTAMELASFTADRLALRTAARLWLRSAALLAEEAPSPDAATERAQRLQRAMDLLLAAEQLGWGARNPLADALYDPLRERPEFQALQQRRTAAEAAARKSSPK